MLQYQIIEVQDVLKWGTDVVKYNIEQYSITNEVDYSVIIGKIESLFEDGSCDFRFGPNIITIEMVGESYPIGTFVKIKSKNLILYDIGF